MTYRDFVSSFSLDRRIPIYYTLLTGIFLWSIYQFGSVTSTTSSSYFFLLSSIANNLQSWYLYIVILSFFHLGEYTLTAWYQPQRVMVDSFLLNHSKAYHIAVSAAIFEYWLEHTLIQSYPLPLLTLIKTSATSLPFYIGLILVSCGQLLRILAMATAGSNFSHLIMDTKEPNHQLVIHGVYKFFRHPAYTGWFYWSIGTQCILGNPICMVLYTLVSWKFFADRIPYEEYTLLQFYGWKYVHYARSSMVCIPFIHSPAYNYTNTNVNREDDDDGEKEEEEEEIKVRGPTINHR